MNFESKFKIFMELIENIKHRRDTRIAHQNKEEISFENFRPVTNLRECIKSAIAVHECLAGRRSNFGVFGGFDLRSEIEN